MNYNSSIQTKDYDKFELILNADFL